MELLYADDLVLWRRDSGVNLGETKVMRQELD